MFQKSVPSAILLNSHGGVELMTDARSLLCSNLLSSKCFPNAPSINPSSVLLSVGSLPSSLKSGVTYLTTQYLLFIFFF